MKKLIPAIVVAALAFNSCTKENSEIPEINNISTERKALMLKFGSTTCGICNAHEPALRAFYNENKYTVIGISVLQDVTNTTDISWQYNYSGIPAYTEGTYNVFDTTTTKDIAISSATATIGTKADIGVGLKPILNGDNVTIKMTLAAFKDISGTYNVAVYAIEDGVDVSAVSGNPGETRDHVYRGAANNLVWGMPIANMAKGEKKDYTMVYNLGTQGTNYNDAMKMRYVAVIYKMENNRGVEVMNCNVAAQQ
ncbi:MAG: Omp28-related outer membrane protein [Bacteroidota bacterium]